MVFSPGGFLCRLSFNQIDCSSGFYLKLRYLQIKRVVGRALLMGEKSVQYLTQMAIKQCRQISSLLNWMRKSYCVG